ncbi:hypothetical protein OG948_33440 [Embleya sp. NBC_00888]|uniref:hypothetical protein n=1 Tax=Embleya sp. NBC_00888 TaxID=2975960 RepID=UPI00386CFA76|nr:hypothetical protein OG948_33440 [Embleya sp. NBC_00888]
MANRLPGESPYVDEELASASESGRGLGDDRARSLPAGRTPWQDETAVEERFVLEGSRDGGFGVTRVAPDGTLGQREWPLYLDHGLSTVMSVVAWALTETPVGDPVAAGALGVYR